MPVALRSSAAICARCRFCSASSNTRACTENNHFTEMCCGTEAGSYLRLIDSCITQLKAQGPSKTCDESKEEEEGCVQAGTEGHASPRAAARRRGNKREFFIDNLLVRIHFIVVMVRWTGLAPWEFEFPFPGSLASTFLVCLLDFSAACRSTSLIRNCPPPQGFHMGLGMVLM